MALSLSQTVVLGKIIKPTMRVVSLGYPDLVAPMQIIEGLLGEKLSWLEYRADSEAICKRHGLPLRQIPDAESCFRLLGCKLDVYDIVRERGCEIILDLNEPMDVAKQYDIVLDVGTAEHCFNIGQALINMAMMVKEGGYIIHENPFNWGNHGFYNLNPTLFHDFYTENGFKVEELKLVTRSGLAAEPPPTQRFESPPQEVNIFCVAKRMRVTAFSYPVQTKYKSLIPAAGDSGGRAANARAIGE